MRHYAKEENALKAVAASAVSAESKLAARVAAAQVQRDKQAVLLTMPVVTKLPDGGVHLTTLATSSQFSRVPQMAVNASRI